VGADDETRADHHHTAGKVLLRLLLRQDLERTVVPAGDVLGLGVGSSGHRRQRRRFGEALTIHLRLRLGVDRDAGDQDVRPVHFAVAEGPHGFPHGARDVGAHVHDGVERACTVERGVVPPRTVAVKPADVGEEIRVRAAAVERRDAVACEQGLLDDVSAGE
jgi:hypothetical protein